MAIFTFSTKGSRPADEAEILAIKEHCYHKGINLSGVILKLLREWHKEVKDVES